MGPASECSVRVVAFGVFGAGFCCVAGGGEPLEVVEVVVVAWLYVVTFAAGAGAAWCVVCGFALAVCSCFGFGASLGPVVWEAL